MAAKILDVKFLTKDPAFCAHITDTNMQRVTVS